MTCPTHARMHSWRNKWRLHRQWDKLLTSQASVTDPSSFKLYSIADYTCLMSGEQVYPSLEGKTQPKRRLPLHFLAELRFLRTPPPIQIASSPPPPIGLFQLIGVHPHGGVNVALPLKIAKLVHLTPKEPIINQTGTPQDSLKWGNRFSIFFSCPLRIN